MSADITYSTQFNTPFSQHNADFSIAGVIHPCWVDFLKKTDRNKVQKPQCGMMMNFYPQLSLTSQSLIALFPVWKLNVPAGHLRGADTFPGQLYNRNILNLIYILVIRVLLHNFILKAYDKFF